MSTTQFSRWLRVFARPAGRARAVSRRKLPVGLAPATPGSPGARPLASCPRPAVALAWRLVELLVRLMERIKRLEIVQTWLWNVGIMGSKVVLVVLLCLNLSLSGEHSRTKRGS